MDYALAKQLKDAGYTGDYDLKSLIEACGEGFYNLLYGMDTRPEKEGKRTWYAYFPPGYMIVLGKTDTPSSCQDDSPTVAVAKLWLTLNKK